MIGQFQPSDQATYKCVARNMYNDEVNATTNVGKESFIEDFLKVIINCPHAAIIVYVKGTCSEFFRTRGNHSRKFIRTKKNIFVLKSVDFITI